MQAAKRRSGHLYVATADCRVAVTGTVFSVTAGVKGSRVSVMQGEVHVSQDNHEKVLHPGDQTVTSPNLEAVSVKDDIAWSRNREKLTQQLESLRAGLAQIRLPELRYTSKLLGRLPASTVFFASIPNLAGYLGQTQEVFNQKMAESPELRAWWGSHAANVGPILEKLRAASEYVGDEIVVTGFITADGKTQLPVFFAEAKRAGFTDFFQQQHPPAGLTVEERNGLIAFGPKDAVAAFAGSLDAPAGGFQSTPFYARIAESYRRAPDCCCAPTSPRSGPARASPPPAAHATSSPRRRKSITRWKLAPRWASTARAPAWLPGWPIPRPWARWITFRPTPPSSPRSW